MARARFFAHLRLCAPVDVAVQLIGERQSLHKTAANGKFSKNVTTRARFS